MCSFGVVFGAFARNLIELYLTVGFLNGKCLKQTHTYQNVHTTAIFTGLLCCRVWLCIDMDPHSDHAGLVL